MKNFWKFLILCFGGLVVIIISCLVSAKLEYQKQHDLNRDGVVNMNDVVIMAENWLTEKGN
jgi:hypothetical protein